MLRLMALVLAVLLCAPTGAAPLVVRPGEPVRAVGQSMQSFIEPRGAQMGVEDAQARVAEFRDVARAEPNFSSRPEAIWLRLPIQNPGAAQERVIHVGANFMSEIEVWLEAGGMTRRVFRQSASMAFDTRPLAFHELASPLALPPGPSVLWMRYRSDGSTAMPFNIETPTSFINYTNGKMARDFVLYGIIIACALAGLIAAAVTQRQVFLSYGVYASSVLLYILQREGHAFRFLWPDRPEWNEFSSLPLGAMLVVTAAWFARNYLETWRFAPRTDRVLSVLMASQLVMVAASLVVEVRILKDIAVAVTALSVVGFLVLGIAAMRRAGVRYIFYVIGWSGFLVAVFATVAARWLGIELTRIQILTVMSGAMVFDGLMMGLALVSGYILLRRERDAAMRARLAVQENNVKLMQRLSRLDRSYELAQTMAQASSRALAETCHDLRQPLFALRAVMANMDGEGAQRPETVAQSLDYMEQLVENVLAEASREQAAPEARAETFEAGLLIETLAQVHEGLAQRHGKALRTVNSSAVIEAEPLRLLRILGNFVTNAIEHGTGDRVLIGVRRRGGQLVFEVHNHGALAPDKTPAEGRGLGLGIVSDLAGQQRLDWSLASPSPRGTVARLVV
ncbi:MAG: sensor histidine kinase [Polymorphobacter sp.]|uniref:sensor histidine kinase n=1 Tax=Polymorphobacter sp. TaxID=1909290 RepID=UPI003A896F55